MGTITKEELYLLDVFRKNPISELTFKEIMLLSGKNSRNWVFKSLKKFVDMGLVYKKKVGNNYLYSANLGACASSFFPALDFADAHINKTGWSKKIYKIINEIRVSIVKITPFLIILVFGSYANKGYTKKSDLDLAVIVDIEKEKIKPFIERIARRELIKIDYYIFTKEEFKEMLKEEEENLGKEILRKHIILWGSEQFYELIDQERDYVKKFLEIE